MSEGAREGKKEEGEGRREGAMEKGRKGGME